MKYLSLAFAAAVGLPGELAALCGDAAQPEIGYPFEFVLSKPDQVRQKDLEFKEKDGELAFRSHVSKETPIEVDGSKRSQRTEIRETESSSRITSTRSRLCYTFEFRISEVTALPAAGSTRAKLTIAQFHQEPTRNGNEPHPALLINLTPEGEVMAVFSDYIGARQARLIPASADLFSEWWRIEIGARWSTDAMGRTSIWVGPADNELKLKVDDRGPNTTTGHVYQKLGAYRSFIERDPEFAESQVHIQYRSITRNGVAATFRKH